VRDSLSQLDKQAAGFCSGHLEFRFDVKKSHGSLLGFSDHWSFATGAVFDLPGLGMSLYATRLERGR
jgi:hypothetical protein